MPLTAKVNYPQIAATERVLILLCTFNEAENLPKLIRHLRAELPQADILVVDDSSPDGTGDWVENAKKSDSKLFLIVRSGKLGLGSATRDGMAWGISRDYHYLIQMDADFSHRPADVPRLLAACLESQVDIAIGTRYASQDKVHQMPIHRRLVSRWLNRYVSWLLDLPVSDCSGSFRCYRVSFFHTIQLNRITCNGYGFLEELLVHIHRAGGKMVEVPIQFDKRAFGKSKLGLSDVLGILRIIHQLARKKEFDRRHPEGS